MLLLTAADVRALLTMPHAIEASKDALRLDSRGRCTVPLRTNLDVPARGGHVLVMPALVPDLAGIKIASVFPRNAGTAVPSVAATIMLLDATTGAVCALMDGTYLTALRTGAVQGAATDALARPDAHVAALIGTGGQAAGQLEAMLCVRDLTEVRVAGRGGRRARRGADGRRAGPRARRSAHGVRLGRQAVLDVMCAQRVYTAALAAGAGRQVEL